MDNQQTLSLDFQETLAEKNIREFVGMLGTHEKGRTPYKLVSKTEFAEWTILEASDGIEKSVFNIVNTADGTPILDGRISVDWRDEAFIGNDLLELTGQQDVLNELGEGERYDWKAVILLEKLQREAKNQRTTTEESTLTPEQKIDNETDETRKIKDLATADEMIDWMSLMMGKTNGYYFREGDEFEGEGTGVEETAIGVQCYSDTFSLEGATDYEENKWGDYGQLVLALEQHNNGKLYVHGYINDTELTGWEKQLFNGSMIRVNDLSEQSAEELASLIDSECSKLMEPILKELAVQNQNNELANKAEDTMNIKINEEILIDYFNEVIEFVDVLSASKIPNNLDNKIEAILNGYKREWEAVEPGMKEGEMLDDILDRCIEELSGNKIDLQQTPQNSEIDNPKVVDISKQNQAHIEYFALLPEDAEELEKSLNEGYKFVIYSLTPKDGTMFLDYGEENDLRLNDLLELFKDEYKNVGGAVVRIASIEELLHNGVENTMQQYLKIVETKSIIETQNILERFLPNYHYRNDVEEYLDMELSLRGDAPMLVEMKEAFDDYYNLHSRLLKEALDNFNVVKQPNEKLDEYFDFDPEQYLSAEKILEVLTNYKQQHYPEIVDTEKQRDAIWDYLSELTDVAPILEAFELPAIYEEKVKEILSQHQEEWLELDHDNMERLDELADATIKNLVDFKNKYVVDISKQTSAVLDYLKGATSTIDDVLKVLELPKYYGNVRYDVRETLDEYKNAFQEVGKDATVTRNDEKRMLRDDILDSCTEDLMKYSESIKQDIAQFENSLNNLKNDKLASIYPEKDSLRNEILDNYTEDLMNYSKAFKQNQAQTEIYEIFTEEQIKEKALGNFFNQTGGLAHADDVSEILEAFGINEDAGILVYDALVDYRKDWQDTSEDDYAVLDRILSDSKAVLEMQKISLNHHNNIIVGIDKQNFLNDEEKMADFKQLSKADFLKSYSYLTEKEYDNTQKLFFDTQVENNQNNQNNNTIKNKKTMETNNTNAYAIPVEKMESVKAQLAEMGIDVAAMEQNGDLEKLQSNRKTDHLYPGTVTFPDKETSEDVVVNVENRLWLKVDESGDIEVRKEQKIDPKNWKNVFKTELTDEQKENLRSIGTAGELVPVVFKDGDEPVMSIVTRCSLTNQLKTANPDTIKIFPEFYGVKITPEMEAEFRAGKAVVLKDMTTLEGKKFDSQVFYSVDQRKLTFSPPAFVAGVKLTTDQKVSYEAGEVIYLEGLKAGDETFDSYVRKSPHKSDEGAPQFSKDGTFKDLRHSLSKKMFNAIMNEGKTLDKVKLPDGSFTHVRKNPETGKLQQSKDGTFAPRQTQEQNPTPPKKSTGHKHS
jgi:hypothetical protein